MVEQLTLNQLVLGSSPSRGTTPSFFFPRSSVSFQSTTLKELMDISPCKGLIMFMMRSFTNWVRKAWLFLLPLLCATASEVVFENTAGITTNYYMFGRQYGDDINLAGTGRVVTEFSFLYFGDVSTNLLTPGQWRIRFYKNDGALDKPSVATSQKPNTLLWDSGLHPVSPGYRIAKLAVPNITVPDRFTWTVEFYNLSQNSGNGAGLVLAHPPTIGAILTGKNSTVIGSFSDFWLLEDSKVLDSWTLQIFSNNPNEGPQGNFFARVVTLVSSNKAPTWTSSAPNRRVSEGLPLSFQLKASDADLPPQPLTFSLVSGPDGLTINPTSGLVSFRPTEAQGPSTNSVVVRVSDNGTPALSATNSFTVVVMEVNQAPELVSVGNLSIDPLMLNLIRLEAKDADLPAQKLTFALVNGPKGMTIDPAAGVISWTPTADQASTQHPVTVSVSDGFRTVSTSFQVTVRAANTAPYFINLTGRVIRELTPMSFKLTGRDSNLPAQKLTYGLVSGPLGLTVGEDGQTTWTPTEDQGPSTNTVTVRVTDNGSPSFSTTNTFVIYVTEANTAPTFSSIYNRSFLESSTLNLPLVGRDPDLPAQKLTFTLVSGPKGLTMTDSGVIAWKPTEDQGPSTNRIVVKVTDNASIPLSTTTNFVLIVNEANTAPVFAVSNLTVAALGKLSVALTATDADIPVQTLSYRLESGPQGLTVSPNGLLEWTPAANLALTTNVVKASVSDGLSRIQTTFRIIVRAVGSGPGSETKASQRTSLSLVVEPNQSLALKVAGPEGGRFRVESSSLIGAEWSPVEGVGEIETLGQDAPVVVPIPSEGADEFRQFRLKKQ